jgi:hypothetical protein
VGVAAGEWPVAEIDPQLVDPPAGPAVGHDCNREVDSACLTVEVENYLLEALSLGDDVLDVLDRDVVPTQPRARFGDERLEGPHALDTPAYGVVQLGTPAKDLTSASGSPASRPSKYGTAASWWRPCSSSRSSTRAENSSGVKGIRGASHIPTDVNLCCPEPAMSARTVAAVPFTV